VSLTHSPLTPVLVVDEVGYSTDDVPVHHSIEFHPGNLMSFELVRRRGPIGNMPGNPWSQKVTVPDA